MNPGPDKSLAKTYVLTIGCAILAIALLYWFTWTFNMAGAPR